MKVIVWLQRLILTMLVVISILMLWNNRYYNMSNSSVRVHNIDTATIEDMFIEVTGDTTTKIRNVTANEEEGVSDQLIDSNVKNRYNVVKMYNSVLILTCTVAFVILIVRMRAISTNREDKFRFNSAMAILSVILSIVILNATNNLISGVYQTEASIVSTVFHSKDNAMLVARMKESEVNEELISKVPADAEVVEVRDVIQYADRNVYAISNVSGEPFYTNVIESHKAFMAIMLIAPLVASICYTTLETITLVYSKYKLSC